MIRPLFDAARRLAAALVLAVSVVAVAPAGLNAAATLDKRDRADVQRVEAYLNSIRTLKARFLQVSSNGEFAEGDIVLSRPGKLKLEYAPPVPILIVVKGRFVLHYDKELKQAQYIGLDQTPAGILVKEKIDLAGGELTVTGVERGADALRLSVVKTADPNAGSITLAFSEKPLMLRKWSVTDAQGLVTNVALMAPKFGAPVDPKVFDFEPPNVPSGYGN